MPLITISRGSTSGGEALARSLSDVLHVPCVGREVVVEAAARLGISDDALAQKLERSPGLWDRLTFERRMYIVVVQSVLAEQALEGKLVYHGYAGHLLLTGVPAVLRVRLIAPMEKRVRTVMEQNKLSKGRAEAYIRQVDEGRSRFSHFVYGVDLQDPAHYDLVVNLEVMSVAGACAVIVEASRQPEYAVTNAVREKLADFALACRARVALATHPVGRGLDLEVTASGGIVRIRGEVPESVMLMRASTRWEEELRAAVESVPGVKNVRLEVEPVSPFR